MPKISSKLSTTLSMLLCGALAAVIAVICFRMPEWLGWLLFVFGKPSEVFVPTLCIVYFTALIAYGAIALLFVLLCRIRRGEVFTSGNVSCLRALSWLCLCAAACYAALSVWFIAVAPIIAFACAFMGAILRVVKNAFEIAVDLKAENDLTV